MQPIATVRNPALVSRFDQHALESSALLDKTYQAGVRLKKGALLGKLGSGKYRAYVEIDVKTGGDFSNAAVGFTLDVATKVGQGDFEVGDVITSVSGTALGTILTYNKTTGVGTLAANSANNLAAGQKVKVSEAVLALGSKAGRILKDEVLVEADQDTPCAAYFEGFFLQANTTVTAAALTTLGGFTIESGEIRLV